MQIFGAHRLALRLEDTWCPHHNKPLGRCQTNGDQIRFDEIAEPYARVIPFRDDINRPILANEFELKSVGGQPKSRAAGG